MDLGPGDFAENLTVRGLDCSRVSLLDRFRIGEVELEVTQIGKACHGQGCAIFQRVGRCVMPDEGVFTRVVQRGTIRPGDAVEFLPKTLRFRVVTLSDRAALGEYEDRSGPRVRELLEAFLESGRLRGEVEPVLLSDDPATFRAELEAARAAGVEVVISSGGTGVGPRDLAPETVTAFCDRLVPGIPEGIRAKFGAAHPNAYLSRAVVGLAGTMVVYALPGSVRAVEEYMGEILVTMQHLLLMVRGIDAH
jgi:molybdenum cofactor synthesis domain-containing protein